MHNAEKTESVTFRVTHEENAVLRRAAASARMSLSDYLRSIAVPWAKSDLENPRASEAPPARESTRPEPSPVTAVARANGMTRDEFRRLAAELLAEAFVARQSELPPPHRVVQTTPPPARATLQPPAPSGFYQRKVS